MTQSNSKRAASASTKRGAPRRASRLDDLLGGFELLRAALQAA